MTTNGAMVFSQDYGAFRVLSAKAAEQAAPFPEDVLQCAWFDQMLSSDGLVASDGRSLRVLAPGWWNHGEGPDFQGAQIEFNGRLRTGDVEIHLTHAAWRQHGHHLDPRYDNVILVAVLEEEPPRHPPTTSKGRPIPTLLLSHFIEGDLETLPERLSTDDYPYDAPAAFGDCSHAIEACGPDRIEALLRLAGEWRVLNKAKTLRDRIDRVGPNQALYEAVLTACGFSRYKHPFRVLARQLPYERVIQLARRDGRLVEAALFQVAGLLPEEPPSGTEEPSHLAELRALREKHLPGLRRLPLDWKRHGVRPTNYPERRLAGAARLLARHACDGGFLETVERVWRQDLAPGPRRKAFEDLFPRPMGFWATHCTWTGKELSRPVALLGPSRIRGIIGNVFVPMALALARRARDRRREEVVFEFFAKLPAEPDNQILKAMVPRLFGSGPAPRLDFRLQQGMLQMFYDWCEPNPSCRACSVIPCVEAVASD